METIWRWIAWHFPDRLLVWAVVRVGVYATSGRWSSQNVTTLTLLAALQRWETREDQGRPLEDQAMMEVGA